MSKQSTIDKFSGHYRFLSNFADSDVELDGEIYPSIEHAYQAAKTLDTGWREKIRSCKTAGEAKKLGKIVPLHSDWDRVEVMRGLLKQKFSKGNRMRDLLDGTGDAILIEGNWWGDVFWGQSPVGTGENWLGRMLMEIRDESFDSV